MVRIHRQKNTMIDVNAKTSSNLLLCIILCVLFFSVDVYCHHPQCHKQEREALLAFKNSVDDPMESLTSWQGNNCCHGWKGIACDKHTGLVTKLDLRAIKIRPVKNFIHPSVWKLKGLQYLDMSFNDFSGHPLPAELSLLKNLTYLELSFSGFSGLIPWQIGSLASLQHLGLGREIFTPFSAFLRVESLSWIGNMTALRYLFINGVDLRNSSYDWDQHISGLSELHYLGMAGCRLEGDIRSSILSMKKLEHLDLSYNTFSSNPMPQWLSGMQSLMSLNLSGCALRGPIVKLPNLQELSLDRNYYLSAKTSDFLSQYWPNLRRLSLSSCNLGGMMTCSMPRLSSLVHLDLSNNQIRGSIPSCVDKMQNLKFLDLSFNNISGLIPKSLSLLSNITHLDLRHNKLKGTINPQMSRLSSLQYLGLGHNQLNGTIPKGFLNLSELSTLDVSFNYFADSISQLLFQGIDHLKVLHLSNSGLNVSLMDGKAAPFSLEQLSASSCNIEGLIPEWLSTQSKMVYLDLSNNKLHGNIPHWLWSLPNLAQVNLSSNNLEGTLPSYIHLQTPIGPRVVDLHSNQLEGLLPLNFGPMEVLDLSDNQFSGSISSNVFGDHWNINFLSISGNNLSGEIPKSLSGSRSLEILDLSKNNLSGDLSERFINCSSLVVLNLEQNFFSGELPYELGNMTKLQTLHMTNNNLSGPLPSSLQNCKALEILELGNNNINGSIPKWIQYLTRLRILILKANKLQGSIPKEMSLVSNIQILVLSHNNLSGTIPQGIGNFTGMIESLQPTGSFILRYVIGVGMTMSNYKANAEGGLGLFYGADVEIMSKGRDMHFDKILSIVTSMDLSNNNLGGHIPSEIGYLTGLVTLNLSSNSLSGPIPETIGNMRALESLDLSSNQLSGRIPEQLASIDFLQYLDLGFNRLSGMIPQGRHFDTFEASSFLGNPDLCGSQLNKSCYDKHTTPSLPSDGREEKYTSDLWLQVAVGLCYGMGFAVVITVLVVWEQCRNKLFIYFDMIFMMMDQFLGACR